MSRPPATSRKVGRVLVLLALFLVCQRATQTARALLGAGAVPFPRSVPPGIWAQNLLVARRAKADGTLDRGEAEDHEDVKGPLQPREDEDKASEKDQDEVEEATTEVSRNKAVDEIVAFARDEQLQKTVQEKEEIKEDKGFDKSTEKDTFSQKRFDMAVKKWDGAQKDLEGAREDRDFARQRRREAVQNGNEKERKEAEEAFEKAEEAFAKAESKVETAKEEAEKANDELEKAKSTAPLQVQGARRQLPYIAPKYTMNKAFCDDKKLLVCDFENSAEFAIVSKELMQQLTAWVEECNSSRGICAINGMVKTGKSTVLTRLLPQIILTTFPDAEICFLDFAAFLNAGSEPGEMEERLLKEVCSWATASGFDVGLADQLTLNQLMDILDRSGRTYFFLIDEVQRYFEVRQGTFPLWDTLKGFVGVNRQRSNLHFAITGSAMVLAWQNFLKMTPNGFTFVGECRKIFLPWRHPRHELDYAKCKLLATAANESERDELTELLAEISSVPLMAYTATMRKYSQSVKDTQLQVNLKLRAEFVTEMTPLLGEPTWSKPECLQYIRDLAMGGATSDPADFFDEILYGCFFEPYIQKENGKFSFADNPWTVCMAQCVDENGTLVRQSNFPVLQWYQNAQRLQQLARVGELVCGTLRQWDRMSGDDKKLRRRVETICRKHGRQHGWHPKTGDPCFQQLLSWSNDGVNKSIAVRWSTKQRPLQMKWCTYLEMLRNAKAHFTVNNQDDFAKLLFNCLPGRADLLLAALKNFTIAW